MDQEVKMSSPKLTEVFQIGEASTDWKNSYKQAIRKDKKAGHPLALTKSGIPKGPGKPAKASPIRNNPGSKQAPGDPIKDSTAAEHFATEEGDYLMFRGVNGMYYARFISPDVKTAHDLGEHTSRQEAIDAILEDHDKNAAGLGEQEEIDEE